MTLVKYNIAAKLCLKKPSATKAIIKEMAKLLTPPRQFLSNSSMKKPHRWNRALGNIPKKVMLTIGIKAVGVGNWEDQRIVKRGIMREDGERHLFTHAPTFFENINRGGCNDGSRKFIPVLHRPHWKCRCISPALAFTFECFVSVSSRAATSGKRKK